MPSNTPRPGRRPVSALAGARLRQERADLRDRISRLDADMATFFEASRDSNADDEHDPEGQTIAFERAQLSAVTDQVRQHLVEIDAALRRVEEGTYGLCEVCRQEIQPARLEARPTARTCVQHAPTRGSRS
jgi:DnaK suppressor protein